MAYTIHDGAGVIVERSTDTGTDWLGPWEVIPGFTGTVTGVGGTARTYDATTHEVAASTGFTAKRTALSDVSDVSGTVFWDPDDTVHQAILTDQAARTVRQYRITTPGATRKYGVQGQISVGGTSYDMNAGTTAVITISAQSVNYNVA